ncbi:MAG: cation transporter [Calditrichaeota bacterium]|nr:MAG: cation transporter [Calditrichota bacterium]
MHCSTFRISQMDCPSEEAMIRMSLEEISGIDKLDFDIPSRTLRVYHENPVAPIEKRLESLNLGSKLEKTETVPFEAESEDPGAQSRLLWAVLWINFAFFVIEMTTGWLADSMGLIADSLDMLADAGVYGLSLMAVGGSLLLKKRIARISGYFQMTLAALGFLEVVRRFIGLEEMPDFRLMILISILALIANGYCLYLLQKSKSREAHMQASMIFTSNDVIINTGVIIAGILVLALNSGLPDLIVGAIVFVIVLRGAVSILKLGR